MLSLVIFLPIFASLGLFFIKRTGEKFIWFCTLATAVFEFLLALSLLKVSYGYGGFYLEERTEWIPAIGASYHLGIDSLSLILVLLTTFLVMVSVLFSYGYIQRRVREFSIAILFMEGAIIGAFLSLDLLLFFVFWEAMLIPMYFIIGIWGHTKRIYATFKFIIYTMLGSLFLFAGILMLYFYNFSLTGVSTFDLLSLRGIALPDNLENLLFILFFISFAVKIPLFPFHTWLPDAHVEAPTAGSVILAGILLKMGVYGFLRFSIPLFPNASIKFAPFIMWLGIVGIIYGGLMAWRQEDLKKLIAYSSIGHMGFIILGVFSLNLEGLQGGLIGMVNHGISTGALFIIAGILYQRRHTRLISDFGGLAKLTPRLSVIFGIVMLSSIGLPGMNTFVGEFLSIVGAYKFKMVFAIFAVIGIIIAPVYMLNMFERVVFLRARLEEKIRDINLRESLVLIPFILLIFYIGLYPRPVLKILESYSHAVITEVKGNGLERAKLLPLGERAKLLPPLRKE